MPDFSMWNYRTQYIDACTLHSRLKALPGWTPPGRSSRPQRRRLTASITCPPSA